MKQKLPILLSALALLAFSLQPSALLADSPTYISVSSVAGTTSSTLILPADPQNQIRIVNLVGSTDTNNSTFSLRSGVGAYAIGTNNAAGTAINVTTTNGLAANDILVIATANGSNFSTTISSFVYTNITLAAACQGTTNGDSVYKLGAATTLALGTAAITNKVYTGEAVFVGNKGRPVRIVVTGAGWSQVDSCTYRLE